MFRSLITTLAASAIAAATILGYSRYTHPNLQGRSMDDLAIEVMRLGVDHANQPILIRLPSIQRQEYISNALATQIGQQMRELQREDDMANQRLASAETAQSNPSH